MKGRDGGGSRQVPDAQSSRKSKIRRESRVVSDYKLEWQKQLDQFKKEFIQRYEAHHVASDMSLKDFKLITTIGKGSFGTVVLAKLISNEEYYALKIIEKARIVRSHQVEQTGIEKHILLSVRFPFIVHMEKYFKDNTYLYFIMPYIPGGEMFSVLRKSGKFDEYRSAFYASQVVLAFEYLHYVNIVYRDLKPENLVFDALGYIKIIDLGFTKVVSKRTYTVCGTPDYLAPEIIFSNGYSHAVDWWALGVLIFEMCSGIPPFFSKNQSRTYELIVNRTFRFPFGFSDALRDIIDKLLQVDHTRRLGSMKGGVSELKSHQWFSIINWMDIFKQQVKAPYIPKLLSHHDTRNFEDYGIITLKHHLQDQHSEEFADF